MISMKNLENNITILYTDRTGKIAWCLINNKRYQNTNKQKRPK